MEQTELKYEKKIAELVSIIEAQNSKFAEVLKGMAVKKDAIPLVSKPKVEDVSSFNIEAGAKEFLKTWDSRLNAVLIRVNEKSVTIQYDNAGKRWEKRYSAFVKDGELRFSGFWQKPKLLGVLNGN